MPFSLQTSKGAQYWDINGSAKELEQVLNSFEFNKSKNPNASDRVFREYIKRVKPKCYDNSIDKGFAFYETLQTEDGNWPGDYGGPLFLLPGLVIVSYVTQMPFTDSEQFLMQKYVLNHQNMDGGWGLHIEGDSTMFGTVMNYVSLRLLGLSSDDKKSQKARKWILENGGAATVPSWGKFYLSILGIYEWEGNNSLFPEMWLLPKWLPFHPSRFWCHTRMVYLPMSYCFGVKIVAESTTLLEELKEELYTQPYKEIVWKSKRYAIATMDSYYPVTVYTKVLNSLTNLYEKLKLKKWRKKALEFITEYVDAEDKQTNYINIGPVNQVINSLVVWHKYGRESNEFNQHVKRWKEYLWLAEDGLKMQGYNGSQLWDTAFAICALTENRKEGEFTSMASKAYNYLEEAQIKEEVDNRDKFFRHQSVGGWPFSTNAHGWPISDCTALGLSAVLRLHNSSSFKKIGVNKIISNSRLQQAVDIILSYQNKDGSWSTYENQRSGTWLEVLNPSEVFGEIMVDYPHVECSSSCIQALIEYLEYNGNYKRDEILASIENGIQYILRVQEENGGWYGNWGVCYTYGTWFAIEALTMYKTIIKSERVVTAIENGCSFLIKQEHKKGGWGESYTSCLLKKYVQHKEPQIVNTSWAILSLVAAGKGEHPSVKKGIEILKEKQLENGDFPQESISGVFNHNCMITYTSYRNIFPLWALSRWERVG